MEDIGREMTGSLECTTYEVISPFVSMREPTNQRTMNALIDAVSVLSCEEGDLGNLLANILLFKTTLAM